MIVLQSVSGQHKVFDVDFQCSSERKVVVRYLSDAPASGIVFYAVFCKAATSQKAYVFFDMSPLESAGCTPPIPQSREHSRSNTRGHQGREKVESAVDLGPDSGFDPLQVPSFRAVSNPVLEIGKTKPLYHLIGRFLETLFRSLYSLVLSEFMAAELGSDLRERNTLSRKLQSIVLKSNDK